MPESITYDEANRELRLGAGRVQNVTPEMWAYEISGTQVVKHWFSYRQRNRERTVIGDRVVSPLMKIHSDRWTAEYTSQLMDLLNVLGLLIELEREQAELLKEVLDGATITVDDLTIGGVLPVAPEARIPKKVIAAREAAAGQLFS